MKSIVTFLFVVLSTGLFAQTCIPNTNSLTFDGTSASLDFGTPAAIAPDSQITVEAWIYPTAFATSSWQNSIVNKDGWTATGGEGGFALRCGGNGVLSFVLCGVTFAGVVQSWKEVISPVSSIPLNVWSHVAGTFDGSTLKCYVNGVLMATTAFVGKINKPFLYPLKVGRCPETTQSRYFTGSIDDVRIFERALTQSEILSNYNIDINPSTQNRLLGYWRFNEGIGTTLSDVGANNVAGTVQSATWSTSVPFNTAVILNAITGPASVAPLTNYTYIITPSNYSNYNWSVTNGSIVSGQGNDTVHVMFTSNGASTLSVVGSNGICSDTTTKTINIIPVSVQTVSNSFNQVLYPNPVSDIVNIKLNSTQFHQFTLYNALGNYVQQNILEGKNSYEVSTTHLAPGIYFYRIEGIENTIQSGKLVVK